MENYQNIIKSLGASQGGQWYKNLPANAGGTGNSGLILGQQDTREEEMLSLNEISKRACPDIKQCYILEIILRKQLDIRIKMYV